MNRGLESKLVNQDQILSSIVPVCRLEARRVLLQGPVILTPPSLLNFPVDV